MITRHQLRAARAFLDWDRAELARRSGLSVSGIKHIETGRTQPHTSTIEIFEKLFRDHDIEFLPNGGICPRDNTLRVIDEGDTYLQLLDDIFLTLKDTGGEVLFAFVRNELSPPPVIESDLRLRRMGIRFRSLIEEGDTFMLYPAREYRWVPRRFFHNNTQVIYGDKFATMILDLKTGTAVKDLAAIIISNPHLAALQRKIFNALWEHGKKPVGKSAAPQTYD